MPRLKGYSQNRSIDGNPTRLVESYRLLVESLVGALINLSPKGHRVEWILDQVEGGMQHHGLVSTLPGGYGYKDEDRFANIAGLHEGTDSAVIDFCRDTHRPARVMRLISALQSKRERETPFVAPEQEVVPPGPR